jgi:hypothetical protein
VPELTFGGIVVPKRDNVGQAVIGAVAMVVVFVPWTGSPTVITVGVAGRATVAEARLK